MAKNFNFNKLMSKASKLAIQSKVQKNNEKFGGNKNNQNLDQENNFGVSEFQMPHEGGFHNPYTFIPFPKKGPARKAPSLLTVDENADSGKRYTGVLNLKVKTISPLLSMDCENREVEGLHFKYKALTIGNDVVVPATSIRGSLRSLMTILSGGTLGYMNPNMWLCQNRDLSMNLSGKNGAKKTKLAEVCSAGDVVRGGSICHGVTRMVSIGDLNELVGKYGETLAKKISLKDCSKARSLDFWRPSSGGEVRYLYTDEQKTRLALSYSEETPWKIKLSGKRISHNLSENRNLEGKFPEVDENLLKRIAREQNLSLEEKSEIWVDSPFKMTSIKIGCADRKHPRYFCKFDRRKNSYCWNTYGQEAMFLKSNPNEIESLDFEKWADFSGQNEHGTHPNLKKGDLVWLEINDDGSVKSLQWSRWGRGGEKSIRFRDALVQTSQNREENFLIPDSMNEDGMVDMVTDMFGMVPDGCVKNGKSLAFAARVRCHNLIFKNASLSGLEKNVQLAPLAQPHAGCVAFYRPNGKLNGYKVYRNSVDGEFPWQYSVQGLFGPQAQEMADFLEQKQAKTVELLKEGQDGQLKISFRALSENEFALLVKCCNVDWKLGGGKSLGLGHCKVTKIEALDENGDMIDLSTLPNLDELQERFEMYAKSQVPVEKMRYPRAVDVSRNRSVQRNGLEWFKRHATAFVKRFKQNLPSINAEDQHLYGYDFKNGFSKNDPPEPFAPGRQTYAPHGENRSPNRETNQRAKQNRNNNYNEGH